MKFELDLFRRITDDLLEDELSHPVLKPIAPQDLEELLDISLSKHGLSDEEFDATLHTIILNAPRTTTHRFFNQLFGGRNARASLGDLLAVILNNTMHTYKVSGVMVGIEKMMINEMNSRIGFGENAGGTIGAGGSMTNFMGMLMARDRSNPEIRRKGIQNTLIAYTSKESHYSVSKNAAFLGIGRDQVRYISSNSKGEMDPIALENSIKNDISAGLKPFFVNATAGTTVMAAFDPISEIGDICKRHNIWLHVDGAYCGSVIFSERFKHKVKGSEKADSFTINAHKMLGTPVTCSFIMVKDKQDLVNSFSNNASYLYQMDDDEYNLGKTSFQCGRRNDALKMWTLWKSVGHKGLEKIVDHQFDLAQYGRDYVSKHKDYKLYSFDDTLSVCFNYKDKSPESLCAKLYQEGKLMVGHGSFNGDTFIRLVTINYGNSIEDISKFFEILESCADNIQ